MTTVSVVPSAYVSSSRASSRGVTAIAVRAPLPSTSMPAACALSSAGETVSVVPVIAVIVRDSRRLPPSSVSTLTVSPTA